MRIGVLALQGGFAAHARALAELGHDVVEVRYPADLDDLDGMVLPGGESTTQLKLLAQSGVDAALDAFVRAGRPVLATCAGLILAARQVDDGSQRSFGWLDVHVSRNAWGRQVHSFEAVVEDGDDALLGAPLVFIRAPRIVTVGPRAQVLARFGDEAILVRQGAFVGASFHPELTTDLRVHRAVFF